MSVAHEPMIGARIVAALAETPAAHAARIRAEVAAEHDIDVWLLWSDRRSVRSVLARHRLIYRLRNEVCDRQGRPWGWTRIGAFINRDHTSVIYGYRAHVARLEGRQYLPVKTKVYRRAFRDAKHREDYLERRRKRYRELMRDPGYRQKERQRKVDRLRRLAGTEAQS